MPLKWSCGSTVFALKYTLQELMTMPRRPLSTNEGFLNCVRFSSWRFWPRTFIAHPSKTTHHGQLTELWIWTVGNSNHQLSQPVMLAVQASQPESFLPHWNVSMFLDYLVGVLSGPTCTLDTKAILYKPPCETTASPLLSGYLVPALF